MARIITRRWKSNVASNKSFGKIYQRVVITEVLDTKDLAQHIASHGSPFTRDVIMAVLTKTCDCVVELCKDSKAVKLGDLGTFKMASHAEGVEDPKEATADKVGRLQLQFLPNQSHAYDLSSTNLARTTAKVGIDQLGDGVTDGFSSESGSDQPSGGGTDPDGDERP